MAKEPARVFVTTGVAGQIGYTFMLMIARRVMLGPNQSVIFHMLNIPPAAKALNEVKMELVDAAFLLKGVVTATDIIEACNGVNVAVMVGGFPRKEGMENVKTKSDSGTWDNHISPENCKWLAENLEGVDSVEKVLRLTVGDENSAAKEVEVYYPKKPKLIAHVVKIRSLQQLLAELYGQLIVEVRRNFPSLNIEMQSGPFDTGSHQNSPLQTPYQKLSMNKYEHKLTSLGDILKCCGYWNKNVYQITTLEFDGKRKSMGVIVISQLGKRYLLVKGAVENVLERSTSIQLLDGSVVKLDNKSKDLILHSLHDISTNALCCLGFAYKDELLELATYVGDEDHPDYDILLEPTNYSSIETELTFVGMIGLREPPREEVHQAIRDYKVAGIRVMVITGDNKNTTEAICYEIGVIGPEEDVRMKNLTEEEFMELQCQKVDLRQCGGLLFSRVEPKHKQEIVRLLKEDGDMVVMTGDGVNNALALKLADIGMVIGVTGTKVAKEASDMVCWNNNCWCIHFFVHTKKILDEYFVVFIEHFHLEDKVDFEGTTML